MNHQSHRNEYYITKIFSHDRNPHLSAHHYLGVIAGQVTVFYIIYLFWFQLLVQTIIDIIHAEEWTSRWEKAICRHNCREHVRIFLLPLIDYCVFGVMLNFDNQDLVIVNLRTLLLHNFGFDLNIMLLLCNMRSTGSR